MESFVRLAPPARLRQNSTPLRAPRLAPADCFATATLIEPLHSAAASAEPVVFRSKPADYLFASNVRFLSILSVVWVHAEYMWGTGFSPAAYLQVLLLQASKFGNVGFFLISGFLLREGLGRTTPGHYFRRRFNSISVPWLFWGILWFGFSLANHILVSPRSAQVVNSWHSLVFLYFKDVFFFSIYWFIPNYFVGIALVLALHRRLPDLVQGAIFLLFSLFYGVNAYLEIIPPNHTAALFGFVFYLWLGSFAYTHRERWIRWLNETSWLRLATYIAIAAACAIAETHLLTSRNSADANNTLRISNQVFSVLAVLAIAKLKRPAFPSWINVKAETFGIYLIHPILISIFESLLLQIPRATRMHFLANGSVDLIVVVMSFLVLYLGSLFLTKLIRTEPRLRWAVGK